MEKHSGRIGIYALILFAMLGTALALPADAGVDFWNLPALEAENDEAEQTFLKLEVEDQEILHRIGWKDEIVRALVDDEIDLIEAARRFQDLIDGTSFAVALLQESSGLTDAECICLHVIQYTAATIADRRDRDVVLNRLRHAYERLRRQSGGIQLDTVTITE